MLCQNCQKRIANVHFTQIINNSKVEMYLCEHCAREKGQMGFGSPFNINSFFPGILGSNQASAFVAPPEYEVCDKCGMSYEEFLKAGKLGCGRCYEIHRHKLEPLIKRLHGSRHHNGKMPVRLSRSLKVSKELEKLRDELNSAIKSEEYEKAAEIRDKIRGLEIEA